jgi:hypothetical protein
MIPSNATTIDTLIRFAKSTKHDKALREFSEHYHSNPELVPFLVRHARKQIRKFGWVCFDLAWAAALMELPTPGGPDFKLRARLKSWYVRGIICCHPTLNGRFELHTAAPDEPFGLSICETKSPEDYGRRLQWADGSPLSKPHPALRAGAGVKPAPPVSALPQCEMSKEVA